MSVYTGVVYVRNGEYSIVFALQTMPEGIVQMARKCNNDITDPLVVSIA